MSNQPPPRKSSTPSLPGAIPAVGHGPNPDELRSSTVPAPVRAAQARAIASVKVEGGRPTLPSQPGGMPGGLPHAARPVTQPPRPPKPVPPEFFPLEARSFDEAGVDSAQIEALVLRMLLGTRAETGRNIAEAVRLPLALVRDVLDQAKDKKLVNYRGTTVMGDFVTELTDAGRDKGIESRKLTSYVGPAPVPWEHYLEALKYQALANLAPGPEDLQRAFADLQISEDLFDRIGPAVTSGRAMFLFGEPGNGKTSLAERMTNCFGGAIWIPHTLEIGGHLVKLFDPAIHRELEIDPSQAQKRPDRRWVRIRRPTVIAGGELTLDMLELKVDPVGHLCEAPLQLKANCGSLVIDDFGRGNTSPRDLLNRWIFPLEKRVDFLQLPDGRKVPAPFDCLLVFSTNLEPRDLADEAFLRRIPYKIYVGDPLEDEFEQLVVKMAAGFGVELQPRSVKYLIDRHYKMNKRPMRYCHPRDLLLQVVHLCEYERRSKVAGPTEWDRVVGNYFGV
ncbi:MAG: AAA family ATPase [Myxococcota bacterium]